MPRYAPYWCLTLLAVTGLALHQTLVPAMPPAGVAASVDPARSSAELPNLLPVSPHIYTGGEPRAAGAFAALVELGIKTVVSVDGAAPDVARARQHGLRYVHIPMGYDGVDAAVGHTLARLVREAEPPFYIHCHHGQHRGPAAAAIAALAAGELPVEGALAVLERAGTSRSYAGLWRDVARYQPPTAGTALPPLVETAQVRSLAVTMATIDRTFDNLQHCHEAGWSAALPPRQLNAAEQALLLKESLHESARNLPDTYPPQLKDGLVAAEKLAATLELALRDRQTDHAARQFSALEAACKQCHAKHRDQSAGRLDRLVD